ncbi:hypothetical protein P7H22_07945 [Paenibacillus larvae]|nr:hypothetical protein [Paenibacillus larvae]MDT2240270.1 hypothetical protein [Paenibacillus larvae]
MTDNVDKSIASEQAAASSEELTAISVDSVEAHRHVTKAIEQVMQGSETSSKCKVSNKAQPQLEEMAGGQRICRVFFYHFRFDGPDRLQNETRQ